MGHHLLSFLHNYMPSNNKSLQFYYFLLFSMYIKFLEKHWIHVSASKLVNLVSWLDNNFTPKIPKCHLFFINTSNTQMYDVCIFHMSKKNIAPHIKDIKSFLVSHYENTRIQIYRKSHFQKLKFSDKKLWYFSYFCSKHRLWVLFRTASLLDQK